MKVAAEFVPSATSARDCPRDRLPEVALVGRSNVGKSSLIYTLVRADGMLKVPLDHGGLTAGALVDVVLF